MPKRAEAIEKAILPPQEPAAGRCGCGAATDRMALRNLIHAIQRLRSALQLPSSLEAAGVSREMLQQQAEAVAAAALADPCCETNPVPVTKSMLQKLYEAVCHG